MINQKLAEIFFEIADILEMKNIQWKPRAYRQAARAIDGLEQPIESIYKKGGLKLLEEIPGVGEGIGKKIVEYLKTGKIKGYERLKKSVPLHMSILTKIPGMGVKKVKKLNKILKIKTIAQLERAAIQHKIAKIPGFGIKSEQDILDGIALMRKSKGRISLRRAEAVANRIISRLKPLKEVLKISTAGSLRRKRPTIGDIDILACSRKSKKIIEVFTKIPNQKILGKGTTKATIVLKSGVQVDLRVVPPESWGAASLYFIGSKNYNIGFRKIAIKKGYKLSEYGLFDKQTGKMIAGKTEREVCKKLGIKWIKPEQRER
ncbi:MAG: helix-hairpin-helix domain-containing protein [Candidatus Woesearchaeota archaeon]